MAVADHEDILVEDEDAIRTIRFNRERDMNRIKKTTLEELSDVLEKTADDRSVRVVLLTGKGRSFAAGVSLDEIVGLTVEEACAMSRRGQEICDMLEEMDAITVAAINGFAFGGGSELALACDIRIGSERMKIGQPEVTLGIMPGFGATQRLPRIVGPGVAMDLILSGEIIGARRALEIGLVSRVFPFQGFDDEVRRYARKLAENAPLAQRMAREAVRRSWHMPFREGLEEEIRLFGISFGTGEPAEGIRAFQEKRKPEWPPVEMDRGKRGQC